MSEAWKGKLAKLYNPTAVPKYLENALEEAEWHFKDRVGDDNRTAADYENEIAENEARIAVLKRKVEKCKLKQKEYAELEKQLENTNKPEGSASNSKESPSNNQRSKESPSKDNVSDVHPGNPEFWDTDTTSIGSSSSSSDDYL